MANSTVLANVRAIEFSAALDGRSWTTVTIQIVNEGSFDISLPFSSLAVTADQAIEQSRGLLKEFAQALLAASERPLKLGKVALESDE